MRLIPIDSTQPHRIRSYHLALVISLFLTLATVAVFWQLPGHDFITIDDNVYVTNNPYVDAGLTAKSIRWAFTTVKAEFWHPLTWLSLMADSQIFGGSPSGYHLTNLLLHIINTLLLFFFLSKATSNLWQSGFAASLFALHPLHVESVAWIAQRKDVLSTLFWLLTLWCYTRFVERPSRSRYAWALVFFILGLMSKPILITLPFTLLLLDYWPLCRFQYEDSLRSFMRDVWPYIREKLPFLGIAAAATIVTYMVQKYGGGLNSLNPYPLSDRIANALISYGDYILKMIWPQNLAFFYPFPSNLPIWQIWIVAITLGIITIGSIKSIKDHPYFIVGWLWYLGTLVPVIGLVKIGDFAMADRYTYIPLIGLFIILAWGLPELFRKWRYQAVALSLAAILVISSLAAVTWIQIRYWSNSITLYTHALQVTQNNFLAHYALGDIFAGKGNMNEAASHFAEAVKIRPDKATLQNELGRALASQGRFDEAIPHLIQALKIKPNKAEAHYNAGLALAKKSINHFAAAVQLHPALIQAQRKRSLEVMSAHFRRGKAFEDNGDIDKAVKEYKQALSNPSAYVPALIKLTTLYAAKKDYAKALALYQIDPTVAGIKRALLAGYQHWALIKNLSIG
jgi:tetratricopeptide (TPR) repeat protein